MTDRADTPPNAPPEAPEASSRPGRLRRWLRRFAWMLLVLVLLAVGARIALPWVLPTIVDAVVSPYGLRVEYDRLSLSLLTGDVELWHTTVRPADGGEEYVNLEYLRVDIDMGSLLAAQPTIRRLEIDGLDVNMHRRADGSFAFLSHFQGEPGETADPVPEPEASADELDDPDTAFDLTPPVRIDAMRLQHVHIKVCDDYLPPSIEAHYDLTVRVSNLGHPDREARFDLLLTSPDALDGLSLTGRARAAGRTLDARLELRLHGWRPGAYRGEYLKQFGILPRAEEVDARLEVVAEGRPSGPKGDHLALGVMMQGVELVADRKPFFTLERAGLRAETLRLDRMIVDFVGVRGVRAYAALSREGDLEVGPVRFMKPERLEEPVAEEGLAALLALARTRVDTRYGEAGVREIRVRDAEVHVHDASLPTPVNLTARLEDLRLRGRSIDTALGARNVSVSARIGVPNVVGRVEVDGMVSMLEARKVVRLDLGASDILLDGIAPYLAGSGIKPMMGGGRFNAELWMTIDSGDEARVRANAGLERIALRSGDGELLLGMESARLEGYLHELARGKVSVQEVEIEGVRLAARRDGETFRSCGFEFGAAPTADAVPTVHEPMTLRDLPEHDAVPDVAPLRRVRVDRFAYEDLKITLTDVTEKTPRVLEIDSAGELRDLSIPFAGASKAMATSILSGWCTAPGLLDRLELSGRVGVQPGAVIVDLGLRTEGFTGKVMGPYLEPLGLEPVLQAGSADGVLSGSVRFGGRGIEADLELGAVQFEDGGEELLAVDQIRLQEVEITDDLFRVGAVYVERPRIRVHHEESGAIRAVGYRTLPPSAPVDEDASPAPAARRPAPTAPPDIEARTPAIRIDRFQVNDAAASWIDHQTDPDLALTSTGSLVLTELVLGRPAGPARLGARFSIPGIIKEAGVGGMLNLGPAAQALDLSFAATGIQLGKLAPYLTKPCAGSIRDGRFHARLEAATRQHGPGARAFDLTVRALEFRDGEKGPTLFGFESARVRVPTVDMDAGLIDIAEISVAGFTSRLEMTRNGGLRPCGIVLPEAEAPPGGKPPVARRPAVRRPPRGRVGPLPLVLLDKLDLELRRFTVTDARFPRAEPLVLNDVRLVNKEPIRALGKDVESNKPLELHIEGGLAPVAERFEIDLTVSPFDAQPDLQLKVKATGVHGDGITRVRPDLASRMDGRPLVDGHFEMAAGLVLKRRARHALDYNLDLGFGLEFVLRDTVFRHEAGGPPLAGVGEIDIDVKRIVPGTGEVWIKSIEIGEPVGRVCLADDGLHLLGIVVKLPEPADPPAETGGEAEAKIEPTSIAVAPDSQPGVAPGGSGEVRLDRFTVTDLDFLIEDRTVDPPFKLPLESLDVDVRGFSTRNWKEKRPVRFKVSVAGGKVNVSPPPPPPESSDPAVAWPSAGAATAAAAKGKEKAGGEEKDERVSFQETLVRGELFFAPTRHGWIKTDLSMMDLAVFCGVAAKSGVEIYEGVFDADVLALLRDDGTVDVDAEFAFTGLSMSEPANGPISRYLRLPAPLDTVIFLVRDENGTIKLPVSFSVDQSGGLSTGQITQEAARALGVVLANAVASSPFRLVGTVTDPLGITGGGRDKTAGDTVRIEFPAGGGSVSARIRASLVPIANRLRKEPNLSLTLKAEMGRGDVEVARVRGNPSRRDCLALIRRLRVRRDRLLTSREVLVRRGGAALAARLDDELDKTIGRLRAFDLELARIEMSLDGLGELVRPGAERLASRRTRSAGSAIAQARLLAVKNAILQEVGPEFDHRIRITRPRFRADTEVVVGTVEVRPTIGTLERRATPKASEPATPAQSAP